LDASRSPRVAQISNLPCRRFPIGGCAEVQGGGGILWASAGWKRCDTADWKSALRTVGNPTPSTHSRWRPVQRQVSFDTWLDALTPHPGPLPVEGRGGAARPRRSPAARFRGVASGWPCAALNRPRRATAAGSSKVPRGCVATPSPLNGERAGVRGERDQDVPELLGRRTSTPTRRASAREASVRLLDREQFHVEDEGGVRADLAAGGAAFAVGELGRQVDLPLVAFLHQL